MTELFNSGSPSNADSYFSRAKRAAPLRANAFKYFPSRTIARLQSDSATAYLWENSLNAVVHFFTSAFNRSGTIGFVYFLSLKKDVALFVGRTGL